MVALKVIVALLAATSGMLLYFIIAEFNPFLRRCNPAVCQSYALSAFHVHSVMQRGEGYCDFGVLPGFLSFNVIKPPGERWQTAVKSCQLKSLLLPAAAMGKTKVLLLGDSVDAHLAQQWCLLLEQPLQFSHVGLKGSIAGMAAAAAATVAASSSSGGSNFVDTDDPAAMKNRDVLYFCKPGQKAAGRAGSISVGMFFLPGVHLNGPFHTGVKGNFLVRIPAALKAFNNTFGGPPDLVMVHSNFWDQSRMWEQRLPGYGHLNKLMPDVVYSWSSNFSLLLSSTREQLPEDTLLATRTAAFPAFSANWLGRWAYIHQLNMAAVEVTRLHGLPVIDLGGMVFGLEPRQYLDDQHHPNKIVLLECANIGMNLLYQQQKRLAAEKRAADELQQQQQQQQLGQQGDAGAAADPMDIGTSDGSSSAGGVVQQQQQQQQEQQEEEEGVGSAGLREGGAAAAEGADQEREQQRQQQQQPPQQPQQQHEDEAGSATEPATLKQQKGSQSTFSKAQQQQPPQKEPLKQSEG